MLGAASGDRRPYAKGPDEAAVRVVVLTTVTEHDVRAAAGSAALAPHRWSGFQQRNELRDVVAIAVGQSDGERDAGDSVIRWCLLPVPPRSTRLRPVLEPP